MPYLLIYVDVEWTRWKNRCLGIFKTFVFAEWGGWLCLNGIHTLQRRKYGTNRLGFKFLKLRTSSICKQLHTTKQTLNKKSLLFCAFFYGENICSFSIFVSDYNGSHTKSERIINTFSCYFKPMSTNKNKRWRQKSKWTLCLSNISPTLFLSLSSLSPLPLSLQYTFNIAKLNLETTARIAFKFIHKIQDLTRLSLNKKCLCAFVYNFFLRGDFSKF